MYTDDESNVNSSNTQTHTQSHTQAYPQQNNHQCNQSSEQFSPQQEEPGQSFWPDQTHDPTQLLNIIQ